MKFIVSILIFLTLAFAEERYSIQVISVEDKSSITDAFMQKVHSTSMPYFNQHVDGNYTVLIGDFSSFEEANNTLPEISSKVSENAFVTTFTKKIRLDPQAKMQRAILMAQARALKPQISKPIEVKKEDVNETIKANETIEIKEPQEKVIIKQNETKRVVITKKDLQKEDKYCKPSKKALREAEISDAIAFYKNSSFYQFTK